MTALVEVNKLVKTYGNGVRAVDDVSFQVCAGQTLGIVGESGCGKSTTAKIVLGLLSADSGTISIDGQVVRDARQHRLLRRRLQLVPQNPQTSFNPRLTIGRSIAFNLAVHKVPRAEHRRRIVAMLDRVGLTAERFDAYPHELSGGQLQRAAIARALVTQPRLVVCDEAVSALDKSVQAQVLNLLSGLQTELGLAYLFISHDLDVVEHMSDDLLVMYRGQIVERGAAADIYRNPTHPYTTTLLESIPGRPGVASEPFHR
nr:hypothetical protein GCM10020063_039780 [Dactylosporangium thailandense]